MAAIVSLFTYSELITARKAASSGTYSSDSVGLLKQRYLGRAQLTVDTASSLATSADLAPSGTNILQYMVQPGKIVYYEAFPEGYTSDTITEATSLSPYISGTGLLMFGPSWTISLREAIFA